MIRPIRLLAALCIVLLPLFFGGCVAFYTYHPVQVTVCDAETGVPVNGAEVQVYYLFVLTFNAPDAESATTDAAGKAVVKTATFEPQVWRASAAGYQPSEEPSGRWSSGRPSEPVTFYLYHDPKPKVTVIIPEGYRGPLKVEMLRAGSRIQGGIGKRDFTFKASADGYVKINATPMLREAVLSGIDVVDASGVRISRGSYGDGRDEVAVRWMEVVADSSGDCRVLYVVGTAKDENEVGALIYDYKNGNPHEMSLNHKAFQEMFDHSR